MNTVSEPVLQKTVHRLLSDPSRIWTTRGGKRLQVLAPGSINPHEGPDFLDMGILLGGDVITGNAEFHRRSSDWKLHNHSGDDRYSGLILHIVLEDDSAESFAADTLVLDPKEIEEALSLELPGTVPDISSGEDLQHYALLRLLRKTAEARKRVDSSGLEKALGDSVAEFLVRYNSRRKRPGYSEKDLSAILSKLRSSRISSFLHSIADGATENPNELLAGLMREKIAGEGLHLRREILLNTVLPLALSLASEAMRIELFAWYWSTPALQPYGILKRKYPAISQSYLWQQQGLLEFMREHGTRTHALRENIKSYGFGEVLSFYRSAFAPLE